MLKRVFGYWKGLLHGRYPDALKSIRICIEAIRILEDSIRMPTTQKREQQRLIEIKLNLNDLKLDIMLRIQPNKHYCMNKEAIQ